MEDILASIRRILNEEEVKPAEEEAAPAPAEDDVLDLDADMMVEDEPAHPAPAHVEQVAAVEPPAPAVAPVFAPVPMPIPPVPQTVERAMAVPFPAPSPTLIAPEAAASAAASVGALMRTLASERSASVYRGGPTIEDLVREEMRPLLKDWLDQHLAPMVERLVRTEIERVVSRMT